MITHTFKAAFHGIAENCIWFQRDAVTCLTSDATIDLLCQTFDGRLISGNRDVNWTPDSYYLTALNYFL